MRTYHVFLIIILLTPSCKEEVIPEIMTNFEASQTKIVAGQSIVFSDLSTGNPTTWAWEFPGGNPQMSIDQNPNVTYTEAGSFSVSLSASNDKKSNANVKMDYITVLSPITASISIASETINQGETIEFSDNSTGSPNQWHWTFPTGSPSTSSERNPVVSFPNYGVYEVTLTAMHEADTSSTTITLLVLPTVGLKIHYSFDGNNANDLSGNDNHGVVAGATLSEDRKGTTNSAYKFDGVDDKIEWGYQAINSTLPQTYSFWVNFEELRSSVLGSDIFDYYQSGVWFSVGQSVETQDKIAINFGNGLTPPGPFSRKTFLANQLLSTNTWYHIVGIVGSTSTMKIYINGVLSSGNYSGSATSFFHTGHSGNIGRVWDPTTFFKGKIDDFRFYSRALTDAEIAILFLE